MSVCVCACADGVQCACARAFRLDWRQTQSALANKRDTRFIESSAAALAAAGAAHFAHILYYTYEYDVRQRIREVSVRAYCINMHAHIYM